MVVLEIKFKNQNNKMFIVVIVEITWLSRSRNSKSKTKLCIIKSWPTFQLVWVHQAVNLLK